jgi:hypothetical protein
MAHGKLHSLGSTDDHSQSTAAEINALVSGANFLTDNEDISLSGDIYADNVMLMSVVLLQLGGRV